MIGLHLDWPLRYLNFVSNILIHYKKSVIIRLTDRFVHLTLGEKRPKNIRIKKEYLKRNNYPPTFFELIIKKYVHLLNDLKN